MGPPDRCRQQSEPKSHSRSLIKACILQIFTLLFQNEVVDSWLRGHCGAMLVPPGPQYRYVLCCMHLCAVQPTRPWQQGCLALTDSKFKQKQLSLHKAAAGLSVLQQGCLPLAVVFHLRPFGLMPHPQSLIHSTLLQSCRARMKTGRHAMQCFQSPCIYVQSSPVQKTASHRSTLCLVQGTWLQRRGALVQVQ